MKSTTNQCLACGGHTPIQAKGLAGLCPGCLLRVGRTPAGAKANTTWADVFPHFEIVSTVRSSEDESVYRVRVAGDAEDAAPRGILQILSGRALQAAGGTAALSAHVRALMAEPVEGLAEILDFGDLVDACYLVTAMPAFPSLAEVLSRKERTEVAEVLARAARRLDPVLREAAGAGDRFPLDPDLVFCDSAAESVVLTPPLAGLGTAGASAETPALSRLTADRQPGDRVGAYELEARLGEGGFGEVWRASSLRPPRTRVALKLLKHGLYSSRARARFDLEQQALARLDHPGIARFRGGGTTADGRPFFAMEWIEGDTVTRFCRDRQLSVDTRLGLVRDACLAVHHAHQKGVMHRDLKPSNIMVTAGVDGRPVPKIIDFGIAKLLDDPVGGDASLLTHADEILGTPATMSPEQAAGAGTGALDARADVYGLGVVLYELLAGAPPFDPALPPDELRRHIRESEPLPPSARTADPALARTLRGELDWIVLKCLEKTPDRRYPSVLRLAEDLDRFAGNQPLEAGPPEWPYRARKFVRRHRPTLVAASAMVSLLVAGLTASLWQAVRATRERHRATQAEGLAARRQEEAEAISGFLTGLFESARPEMKQGNRTISVAESLRIATHNLASDRQMPPHRRAGLQRVMARVHHSLGQWQDAVALQELACRYFESTHGRQHPETLASILDLANYYADTGRRAEAMNMEEEALVRYRRLFGSESDGTARAMGSLAVSYYDAGRFEEALALREQVVAFHQRQHGPEHATTIDSVENLAQSFEMAERREEARILREEVLARRRRALGPEHPSTLTAMQNLAANHALAGRQEEAITLEESVLAGRRQVLGTRHPDTLVSMHNLATIYRALGRWEEALALREEVVPLFRETLGPEHPMTLKVMVYLANSYYFDAGRPDESRVLREEVVSLLDRTLGSEHPDTLDARLALAGWYRDVGRHDEALKWIENVVAARAKILGAAHTQTQAARDELAACYSEAGRYPEALALRESVVAQHRRELGPEHPETLAAMINLAISLRDAGRNDEALALRESVLSMCRRVLGPEHRDTLMAMHGLANSYHAAGRRDEALALREEVHARGARVFGPEHRIALDAMESLAVSYLAVQRRDEALALTQGVLEGRRKGLGPDHPATLQAMFNLAIIHMEAGRPGQAAPLFETALAGRREGLGPEHPKTLETLEWLARCFHQAGRTSEAPDVLEQALAGFRKALGPDHARTLNAMTNLAVAYSVVGRREEALALRVEVLPKLVAAHGPEHPDTLLARHNLALSYLHAKRPDEALVLLEEVRAARSRRLGPDHPQAWEVRYDMATAHRQAGRLPEALEIAGAGMPLTDDGPVVKTVLVKPDSEWRWWHSVDGTDPAATDPDFHQSFYRPGYNDAQWPSGADNAEPNGGFGYGDPDFTGVDIGLPRKRELGNTAYFRHRFTTLREHTHLELRCRRDDGFIVYLDGREIIRDNVVDGPASYRLPARWAVSGDRESTVMRYSLDGLTLAPGEHVLALSLHNTEAPSSDLRIGGITLVEVEAAPPDAPPRPGL